MRTAPELHQDLRAALGEGVLALEGEGKDAAVAVRQAALRPALERLKAAGFNVLADLTAVDYLRHPQGSLPRTHRFKLTYRLLGIDPESGTAAGRLCLWSWVEDAEGPPSVRDLWPCADWLEREVWDMFGIPFADRPGIKRLLLYPEFVGHPLRKDYPLNKRQPLIGPRDEAPRDRMTAGDLRPRIVP